MQNIGAESFYDSCLCTGYRRTAQSVDAQVRQLKAAEAQKVWRETESGAKTDRTWLRRVLDRPDRLAGSTRDLLNIIATIAEKRAGWAYWPLFCFFDRDVGHKGEDLLRVVRIGDYRFGNRLICMVSRPLRS